MSTSLCCICLQAAFRGNTLGLPKICPPENILKVEKSHILTFLNQYHTLDRIVLAGRYMVLDVALCDKVLSK